MVPTSFRALGHLEGTHPVDVGISKDALDRLRFDPFLRFDPSGIADAAYFLWLGGARGDALDHWLEGERREVVRQARERLVFGSSDRNGVAPGVFYQHYRLVASWSVLDEMPRTFLGTREPRRCCICERDSNEATFRKEAHIVPEMFGFRNLLTNEECDQCNAESGNSWENELGYLTLGARAFSGTRMKGGGTPKVKVGESYVGGGRVGVTNITSAERQLVRFTDPGQAEIEVPQPAARPAHAALALAKMAWLMLPPDLRVKHRAIRSLLRGEHAVTEQPAPLFDVWMACRVPATVAIWERVGDREVAELTVMLAFGHMALFWGAPDGATGMNRDLLVPPLPKGADNEGRLLARRFMVTGDARTSTSTRTISIAFEKQYRIRAATSQAVRIVVRRGNNKAEVNTFAISPPGATDERPQFVLSGGELVGRIEIEHLEDGGEWSWSFQSLPTEGDIDRTVAMLQATMGGGVLEISSPLDRAILCEGTFPSSSPAETTHMCRGVQMAYYVGVLNRALGTSIQLGSFS